MQKFKIKMNLISTVIIAVVIASIVLLNMIFGTVSDKLQLDIDLTKDKVYDFSPLTQETISALEDDVTAYLIQYDGVEYSHLEQLLEKYASLNTKFKVKKVDPYENPEIMAKFPDIYQDTGNPSLVVLEGKDRYRSITYYEIFPQTYTNQTSLDAERQITNGIRYVTGKIEEKVILFTTGHGEASTDTLVNLMIEEGYKYGDLDLKLQQIDESTSVIVSYMPEDDFTENEIKLIDKFVEDGGSYLLISSSKGTGKNISAYAEKWGIIPNNDYMLENENNYYVHEGVYSSELSIEEHKITSSAIESGLPFLSPMLPNTLSVTKSSNGAVVYPLLKSSPDSYAKEDLSHDTTSYSEGDKIGPFVMGALSYKENAVGKVCVLSGGVNESFVSPAYVSSASLANYDFMLNLISYFGGTGDETGIRAKNISPDAFTLEPKETKRITNVLLFVVPGIIFLAAFLVWIRRRFR